MHSMTEKDNSIQKQKRIAWDIATSTCINTKEDPVIIYNRIMQEYEKINETKN